MLFVMGTPSVRDPFHKERWDYVQTFSRRGGPMVERTVTLRFENDLLAQIIGANESFGGSSATASDDDGEVASFVKKPGAASTGTAAENPQDASVESAQEEVLKGVDPDIDSINERNAEDREYQRDQDVLDQTPDDDLSVPDIDG